VAQPTSNPAATKKPLFIVDSPAARARWLRARVVQRLNREYLQGAISLSEFERELDAVRDYLPTYHEEPKEAEEE